jgi:hypothetical protein
MKRNSLRSGKPERVPRESPRVIEINENRSDAREQTPNIYPAQTAGHKSHGSAELHQDGKEALVDLVWKHFAEEITEILREVQEDLALDQRSAESSPNTKNNFA